jgi:hypothetical protein
MADEKKDKPKQAGIVVGFLRFLWSLRKGFPC